MEHRKLTKADIDKVRGVEGFPIGSDEDIIALSDAPYYTACPNPFIDEFIKKMELLMMRNRMNTSASPSQLMSVKGK